MLKYFPVKKITFTTAKDKSKSKAEPENSRKNGLDVPSQCSYLIVFGVKNIMKFLKFDGKIKLGFLLMLYQFRICLHILSIEANVTCKFARLFSERVRQRQA